MVSHFANERRALASLALIVGTFSVTALAMVIAVPFGLGAAIFVSEFCSSKLKETLKIVIELLAAIPSVVWGFIGLTVMNPRHHQACSTLPVGLNVFNGGIILALMSVPIMVSIGEDALKAVPDSYREAGSRSARPAGRLVYRVLLPAAKNGLLAAVLLGVGRAVGETMAVLMATGHREHSSHSEVFNSDPRELPHPHRHHRRRTGRDARKVRTITTCCSSSASCCSPSPSSSTSPPT